MTGKIDGVIYAEKIEAQDLISGVSNHGFLFPVIGKTIEELINELNNIKTPYAIKHIVFGNGRFNAILELDRKTKRIKQTKKG